MTSKMRLKLLSAFFAVMWVALMWWTARPLEFMPLVILIVCGLFAGLGWYAVMARYLRWQMMRARREA
jgi:intracellular septation protein A